MKTRLYFGMLLIVITIVTNQALPQQFTANPAELKRADKWYNQDLTFVNYSNNSLTYSSNQAFVGRNDAFTDDALRRWESFRMMYRFDVSGIPDNATITSAKLQAWWSLGSNKPNDVTVTFRIKSFPSDKWSGYPNDQWNAISTATKYDSINAPVSIPDNGTERNFSQGSPFCTAIQSSLSGNSFYMSMMTTDDETWGTGQGSVRDVNIKKSDVGGDGLFLTVNYTLPSSYTLIVKNDIDGGSLTVDDTLYTNVPITGKAFSWTANSQHTLLASTPQSLQQDGFPYTFSYSTWTRSDGQSFSANPLPITATGNTTYEAKFDPQINISGTYTIASGQTGNINPRTTVYFGSGSKLIVNGTLTANGYSDQRILFRSPDGSSWQGIEFNSAGTSSIQYCDINYAAIAIKATNCTNLVLSNITIGNSNFSNGTDDAAMAFYSSTPNVSNVTINGQSGSINGVRFASGSSGSIYNCTIQN